jgi:flagellar basal body-associated protein FliL
MRRAIPLLVFVVSVLLLLGYLTPAMAQGEVGAEDGEGSGLRLIIIIAVIWLVIMAAVITVVMVTRRKSGEEDRESKEG